MVLCFVSVLGPVGLQSVLLNHTQESLYVLSCLAGVTDHRSHLQVYQQIFTFLVVKGHMITGVVLA